LIEKGGHPASFFICPVMRRYFPVLLFVCSLALTFFCYRSGLQGAFLFDDNINIAENTSLRIQTLDLASIKAAAFSQANGIQGRPISMASFALNEYFGGLAPYSFKLTNLAIHLLNGVGIFILTGLILEIHRRRYAPEISRNRLRWISLAIASAWLLHPLNLSGVLYVVQRMASLSALFTLSGLIAYVYGRLRQLDGHAGWGWILAGLFLFTPLALLSKENGALLPAFMLLTEAMLLNFQSPSPRTGLMLRGLFTATVILPFAALSIYSIYNPAWLLGGYSIREFTLPERLMTEARVLWFYLRLIIVPDITQLGLQHDDIAISRSLLEPATTLIACLGILLLAGTAFLLRKRHPIAAFGILFFLLGHSIESSVIGLEIAHEHRNYLPIYGILLMAFYYLLSPAWNNGTIRLRQALAVIFILFFSAVTAIRAGQWANEYELKLMEVAHHPDSLRANADIAYIYAFLPAFSPEQAKEHYQHAISHYQKAADLSPTDTSGLFGLIGLNAQRRNPVEERWVQELEYRLEHRPFAPAAVNSLMSLEKCVSNGRCALSKSAMEGILSAALRNKTLRGGARCSTLFAWSDFLFRSMGNRDAALKAAYEAAEASPGQPDIQLTLVKFLLNLGKPDEAKNKIAQLRQLDNMKIYKAQLDELEKLVKMPEQSRP